MGTDLRQHCSRIFHRCAFDYKRAGLMQVVLYKLFRQRTSPILLACCFLMLNSGAWAQEEQGEAVTPHDNDPLAQMHFRFVGPTGGRTASITGVIGQPAVAYV